MAPLRKLGLNFWQLAKTWVKRLVAPNMASEPFLLTDEEAFEIPFEMWCTPHIAQYQQRSRQRWAKHGVVVLYTRSEQSRVEAVGSEAPYLYPHISFFQPLEMHEYVPLWCEQIRSILESRDKHNQLIHLEQWCQVNDAMFWQEAAKVINAVHAETWTFLIYRATCIGNFHLLHAADPQAVAVFARNEISIARTSSTRSPTWMPAHPAVALYFVEQGWWPKEVLPGIAAAAISVGRKYSWGCSRHAPYASTAYLAQWSQLALGHMGLNPGEKANFLREILLHFGSPNWMLFMWPLCAEHMQDVELDIVYALSGKTLPHGMVQGISENLDAALRQIEWNEDGDLQAQCSVCPGLYLLLPAAEMPRIEDVYWAAVQVKRSESGAFDEYALPELDRM